VTAFLNITGQVIYSKIMEAYTQEAFVLSKLVDHVPTRLDGEKIPGVARIADQVLALVEKPRITAAIEAHESFRRVA
jgi:hypothetical protein